MALDVNALVSIPAPDPGPLRYGLFAAANGPSPFPEEHAREFGMRYDMLGCGDAHGYEIICDPSELAEKDFDPNTAERPVLPFITYASLECGPLGYGAEYLTRKTIRRLVANEQEIVEQALWAGGFGNAPALEDAATADLGAAADIVEGISILEEWASENYGYVPVIHAESRVAAYAAEAHQVDRRAPRLYTPLGSIWSFGGGYPGTGPAGEVPVAGNTWLFITGQVYLWRNAEIFVPPVLEVMNRTTNTMRVLAEREWAVSYDCVAAAVEVTLEAP